MQTELCKNTIYYTKRALLMIVLAFHTCTYFCHACMHVNRRSSSALVSLPTSASDVLVNCMILFKHRNCIFYVFYFCLLMLFAFSRNANKSSFTRWKRVVCSTVELRCQLRSSNQFWCCIFLRLIDV